MKTIPQIKIIISKDHGSLDRLDKWLWSYFVHESILQDPPTRSYIGHLIESGAVTVNNKTVKSSLKVKIGDSIVVIIPEKKSINLKPKNISLDVVYEDEDLIVLNKASGMVVHPAVGHEDDTLVNALLYHTKNLSMKNEERPGIVHRIDKETSGLLVVAKNDFSHESLSQQFKDKTTHRIYFAVVENKFIQKNGTIKSYLARHPNDRKRYASIKENNKIISRSDLNLGKWAVTHYHVLQTIGALSYVQLQLETGRTHQIRVHMSETGHALLGDLLYGYSKLKYSKLKLNRFYLHAAELGFIHPRTQEKMIFKTDWPVADKLFITDMGFEL